MNRYQIIALAILAAFYAVYFGKMLSQRKQGIRTDQIGKEKSDSKRLRIEIVMRIATICVVVAEVYSIITGHSVLRYSGKTIGMVLGILGVAFFITAVLTMADSWRAGIAEHDETKFVHRGIFRISRNPAFLGFDLVYIGILLMFFNWLLLIFTLWAIVMLHLQILQEEKYLPTVFGEEYVAYKKKVCRYFGLKTWKFFVPLAAVIVLAFFGYAMYGQSQMEKLPDLTFDEMLRYTTGGNPDAVITVGVIKNGDVSYKVYGENGKELEHVPHTYEIGSLTKTFTAALVANAYLEARIPLGDTQTIAGYLGLSENETYPTIEELLTHTSGYKGWYFESPMILNYLTDRNIYYGITDEMILNRVDKTPVSEETYPYEYSNFGYAVLGKVVETIYQAEYPEIVNRFAKEVLGLQHTEFSTKNGDLGHNWTWDQTDAYIAAGGLKSNIDDMLAYAQMQLDPENQLFSLMHQPLREINAASESYQKMGIRMDEIGMAWIIDTERGFIWHNGGTDDYNCYLGFCPETQTAVVILSNLPPSYRIPATVMGVKLLEEIQ